MKCKSNLHAHKLATMSFISRQPQWWNSFVVCSILELTTLVGWPHLGQCYNSFHPGQNDSLFDGQYFQMYFWKWKVLYFNQNFTEVCFGGYNCLQVNISLGNGLAMNRQRAIIWTNADPVHWHIYVALGGDELTIQPKGHPLAKQILIFFIRHKWKQTNWNETQHTMQKCTLL